MDAPRQEEVWQRLLSLESHDLVQMRFDKIHARKLNARRTAEINSAARQAREYFRNARASDYSVRSLLTYYGIASLGRALLLLMKPKGGEETLAKGHGLETVGWREVMSGSVASDLRRLGELKIKRGSGLFSNFLLHARNVTLLHVRASKVESYIEYDEPNPGVEIALDDLFSRVPDLWSDYMRVSEPQYANVTDLTLSEKGLEATLTGNKASAVASTYRDLGYGVTGVGNTLSITCNVSTILNEPPMFMHTYVHKMAGLIPNIRLAMPFRDSARFSQLSITYMMSYMLGMLARYYPTHWVALIGGAQGDLLWPTVNRAQQYVESIFPELVAEYVDYAMENPEWVAKGTAKG